MEQQTDLDILAWTIAIGEARGGKYNIAKGVWTRRIPPETVYAILTDPPKNHA